VDRVRTIISYEWRAYWRRFSRAGLQTGNQGIVLILSALIAIKYLQLLVTASAGVANGNFRLLAQLLGAVFFVWLFPLASNARETLASRKWLHLPLSLKERFIVRTVSLLIPPSTWLVIAGSFAICYPMAHARNPGAGLVAGLLFIAMAWLTGLTIAHLLNKAAWRRLFWITALVLSAVAAVNVVRREAAGELLSFRFFPTTLVERAAMGDLGNLAILISLATLGILSVAAGAAALWSFNKSLAAAPEGSPKKISIFSSSIVPGRLGGLIAKDFRYFRRLLDIYLGLAAAILGCLYLMVADVASTGIFLSFVVVVFLCNGALAFNSFGLDNRSGLDRYALLPLRGRAILLSKNLAYLLIAGVQISPMLFVAGWRLGILPSALGLVEAVALAGAYLTWGNWMSVNHPLKMQFFRFANSGAAVVDALGGIIFGSFPGILMIYLLDRSGRGVAGGTALILLVTGTFYFVSITRFGSRLEQRRERIAEALW
jgi:hypothetical protein